MNLSIPQLLFGGIGSLLIYCALTNQTPVNVIKGQKVAPGTNIDPVKTGQASQDGSSGHQWDQGGQPAGTIPFNGPIVPGGTRPNVPILAPFNGPIAPGVTRPYVQVYPR